MNLPAKKSEISLERTMKKMRLKAWTSDWYSISDLETQIHSCVPKQTMGFPVHFLFFGSSLRTFCYPSIHHSHIHIGPHMHVFSFGYDIGQWPIPRPVSGALYYFVRLLCEFVRPLGSHNKPLSISWLSKLGIYSNAWLFLYNLSESRRRWSHLALANGNKLTTSFYYYSMLVSLSMLLRFIGHKLAPRLLSCVQNIYMIYKDTRTEICVYKIEIFEVESL